MCPGLVLLSKQPASQMAFKGCLGCLIFSVLLSLSSKGTEGAEKSGQVQVFQSEGPISVQIGDDLTLECRVNGVGRPGGVRWFLGEDLMEKVIYAGVGKFERVTRTNEKSNEDFTIVIHNITLEDAGIYYCGKIITQVGSEYIVAHGRGTEVTVTDLPPPNNIPVVVGVTCVLLAVLFLVAVYIYVKKKRGRNQDTSRPEGPQPENTRLPKQNPVNKEIVYADLKDPRSLQRPKQREAEEYSEYATVRVAQTVAA